MKTISRFNFSTLYNYSSAANPKVFLTIAKNGTSIGDLVFEVYQNHSPKISDQFIKLTTG